MKTSGEPTVKIAAFKARLSHYLRQVRRGESVTLLDRETPIARVTPIERNSGALVAREPTMKWEDIRWPPPLKNRKRIDSLKVLKELRRDWM
ncbi:MAG: type II toxin-antitoxin system prevent-host-death family antitoxin [Candidatus Coatesbacteria bacterium]